MRMDFKAPARVLACRKQKYKKNSVAHLSVNAYFAASNSGQQWTASIIGAAQQSHSDGGSGFNQTARTIMAQTGLGASYSRGADSARSINNVGKSDSNYKPGGAESNN